MTKIGSVNPTTHTRDEDVAPPPTAITPIEYGGLQAAYDHFNTELFGGRLPNPLITLPRRARSSGYYSDKRFAERGGPAVHAEIALNPDHFTGQTDRDVCDTLVHEMVHAWQYAFGKPSRRGYHNRQWARKMKEIGLHPSSTGAVGGKETGQRMSDYIIDGGPFDLSFGRLAALGWRLNLQSAPAANPTKPPDGRVRFVCPCCDDSFRGKRDLLPLCGRCMRYFVPPDRTEQEMAQAAEQARAELEQAAIRRASALEIGSAGTIQ
jgi:hypothetical protein